MESLKYLNEADLIQLVPEIGVRSVLRGCLLKYNQTIHFVSSIYVILN